MNNSHESNNTRFKPGQSGNPYGRPRGSKNTRMLIQDIAAKRVRVSGTSMTVLEVILRGLMQMANENDLRALELLHSYSKKSELQKIERLYFGFTQDEIDEMTRNQDL